MLEKPRNTADGARGLIELKTLLFRGEADRLKAVETSVEALNARVGDPPRLEAATADILVEALKRAEVARHRELALAIAPVVVASIRNEIENSRETMVETLYPITGQMVMAAVANAIRDLIASMNEKLERLTSVDRWKLQIRARLSGRPMSELALTDSMRANLVRVLFLERESGSLLAAWRADGQPEERGHLIGGLISALNGFARDALGKGGGDLRTLDFDGRDIYVRASPTHIFAAEYDGLLRGEQKTALDNAYLAWLARYARGMAIDDDRLREFVESVPGEANPVPSARKGTGWPIRIVAALVVVSLAAIGTRSILRGWRERTVQTAFDHVVSARPELTAFPISVETNHGGKRVELKGLVPSAQDGEALTSGLREAVGDYQLTSNLTVIATSTELDGQSARVTELSSQLTANIARLRSDMAAIGSRNEALGRQIDALGQSGAKADVLAAFARKVDDLERSGAKGDELVAARAEQAQLAASTDQLSKTLATIESRLADLKARADAPRVKLANLIDDFAIFFDRDQIIARPELDSRLEAIATLLGSSDLGLRVVGYSDDTGSPGTNQSISRKRADVVADMLASHGVSKSRLTIIGRAAAGPIADSTPGVRERNRRVTFEIPYAGEINP